MAGNSRRRGAIRKSGTKKGQVVGSGGQRRRGLEGKGPMPKARDRTGHPASRRAAAAERRSERGSAASRPQRGRPGAAETVAGRNSVLEALRAGVPVKTIYVAAGSGNDSRIRDVLKVAGERGLPILEAPRAELDKVTDGAVHQGVALTLPPYEYAHPDDLVARAVGVPLVVALDGVTDPRNLGAVVRSAAAFGADGVVVPERRSVGMTAGAWKTSAGAAARTPVAQATNLARALRAYRDAGLFVVGLDGDGDTAVTESELLTEPLCLVVGGEGAGLSRVVASACDEIVRIPMSGDVESLNAGVAAGIALYQIAQERSGLLRDH